ncbi:ArsR/SmtB family transcription factor [Natronobacterium texcoconense]|uniref:IclR helix-turn-helix domain-containing protein n=1 Tax=Natronobacterium texcoconense TaxID=1095778 RepID=A0A1H1GLT7_NATTX|nr:winged helix-turn-helix domain-containing protein [Natronobacterium texcoconense]SDR14063.1 IclR helix-turn-helix domain-containing protein [Natronobacterium texcoconense]
MVDDCDPADVFALLDDEYARSILAATSQRTMTATELSDQCEMSLSTVYRRTDSLEECGLLEASTEIDPEGNHTTVYSARLQRLTIELEDGTYDVRLAAGSVTREYADAFTDLWEGL